MKEITVETCRIVFFTDTHFGALYDEKHIERIVEMINGRDADIVILGGDLFDNYARDKEILDMEYLQGQLNRIEAKSGKYAVFGNHDYGCGAVRIYENFMNNCGFYVLDDETVFLKKFNIEIIGFDDYLLGLTEEDFYHIQSDKFHLIVTHEPVISKLIEGFDENFILSGHTHGGQVSVEDGVMYLGSMLLKEVPTSLFCSIHYLVRKKLSNIFQKHVTVFFRQLFYR